MNNNKKYFALVVLTFISHITSTKDKDSINSGYSIEQIRRDYKASLEQQFLKSKEASKSVYTSPCVSLSITDEEKSDHVAICFHRYRRQQKNDHDITLGVSLLGGGNCEKRIFETDDGTIQVTYDDKTRFLSVVVFEKNDTYNCRSILKTEKRLRSAIQLFSKNVCYGTVETMPVCYHITIPRVESKM